MNCCAIKLDQVCRTIPPNSTSNPCICPTSRDFPHLLLNYLKILLCLLEPTVLVKPHCCGHPWFSCHNSRAATSSHQQEIDIRDDMAELICHPAFTVSAADWKSFVFPGHALATLTGIFANGTSTSVPLSVYGTLKFVDLPLSNLPPKVRFAVSTPHFTFHHPKTEVLPRGVLTSCLQNLRGFYALLPAESQGTIVDVLDVLFGIRQFLFDHLVAFVGGMNPLYHIS